MIRLFLFLALLTGVSICYGQVDVRVENSYPDGLYKTKEDFIKKVPTEQVELIPKSLFWNKREVIDTIPGQCFFYYKATDKKLGKMFAVSYQGKLYIQAASVLLNKNNKDKSQTTSFPASFVPVLFGGVNYLYFELELANSWKHGLGYGLGGVGGAAIAQSAIKGKGIVWDFKAQEFDIFRSCKDFNEFIADKYPEGVQECEGQQPDMLKVREAVERLK